MAQCPSLVVALLASTLAACGGKSVDQGGPDPEDGGSAGQGGSAHVAGAGGKPGTGGTGAVGGGNHVGGTGQGGSGGATCEGFKDEPAAFILVDIVNETAAPIYLGQPMVTCEVPPLFDVKDESGTLLPSPSRCRSGCGSDNGGCTALCLFPSTIELAPGAVTRTSWSGLFDVDVELPKDCSPDQSPGRCQRATRIEPGTFTFSARAGSTIDCSQTTTLCGGCAPDEFGNCVTQGALIGGAIRTASTIAVLDESYGISAKALPAPNDGDAPSGTRPVPSVRIVFKD